MAFFDKVKEKEKPDEVYCHREGGREYLGVSSVTSWFEQKRAQFMSNAKFVDEFGNSSNILAH